MGNPGSGGLWEWRSLRVVNSGSADLWIGEPWEWRTLGVASSHRHEKRTGAATVYHCTNCDQLHSVHTKVPWTTARTSTVPVRKLDNGGGRRHLPWRTQKVIEQWDSIRCVSQRVMLARAAMVSGVSITAVISLAKVTTKENGRWCRKQD